MDSTSSWNRGSTMPTATTQKLRMNQLQSDAEGKVSRPKTREAIERLRQTLRERLRQLEENEEERREDEGMTLMPNADDRVALTWLEGDVEMEEETVYLYVSSKNRDQEAWPSPGHYVVNLNQELNNVIEAALVQFTFPLTEPSVPETRNVLRFSLSPPDTVYTVQIPSGNYSGSSMATEITRQMNMALHEADMLAGTYQTESSGLLQVPGAQTLPTGLVQVICTYHAARHRFGFQVINDSRMPLDSPQMNLHISPIEEDIFGALGFNRASVALEGVFDVSEGWYTLSSTGGSVSFNPGTVADPLLRHGIVANGCADLNAGSLLFLDIAPLNDNDVSAPQAVYNNRLFNPARCFAVVNSRGLENMADRLSTSQSSSYPAVRYYREGRSRVRHLEVTVRNPDGSVANFGGVDHFFALRLKVKRFQAKRAVFAR